jgi:hypothetical protein
MPEAWLRRRPIHRGPRPSIVPSTTGVWNSYVPYCTSLRLFGKPTSLWTLDLAAKVTFEQGSTSTQVSGETIRAALKQRQMSWRGP